MRVACNELTGRVGKNDEEGEGGVRGTEITWQQITISGVIASR